MNPVIAAFLTVPPRRIEAVELLHRLYDEGSPDTSTLLLLGPEIEAAMRDVQNLGNKTTRVVRLCLELSAVPSRLPPDGF